MKNNYLLTEVETDIAFAVITTENKANTVKLVELAIKEEYLYEKVTFISDTYSERSGIITMSFDCLNEDGDEDIREVELNLTIIYNIEDMKLSDEDVLKRHKKFGNEMGLLSLLGIFMLASFIAIEDNWQHHFGFLGIVTAQILTMVYFCLKAKWDSKVLKVKMRENGTT